MAAAIPHLKAAFDYSPSYQLGLILSQALMPERRYAEVLELCGDPIMAEALWPLSVNLQIEAFENGEYEFSARAGVLAFEQKADPNIAYNVACAYARASNSEQAIKWVEHAVAAGFDDKDRLSWDPDLESIRSLPEFEGLLKEMRH